MAIWHPRNVHSAPHLMAPGPAINSGIYRTRTPPDTTLGTVPGSRSGHCSLLGTLGGTPWLSQYGVQGHCTYPGTPLSAPRHCRQARSWVTLMAPTGRLSRVDPARMSFSQWHQPFTRTRRAAVRARRGSPCGSVGKART